MQKLSAGKFHFEPPFTSFDHLVHGGEKLRWHFEVERLGSGQVDDELEFGRLHHRQVEGLRTFEDFAGIDAHLTKRFREIGSVAHQPADCHMITHRISRRNPAARRQSGKLYGAADEECIARLARRPSLIGSSPTPKTTGIVAVAALAASVGTLPTVAITATCRRTRSAISAGRRSWWPSSQWYSTVTFWPSTVPVSLRPLRNAATLRALASADPSRINPITRIAGCCARAASGHATAAPPSVAKNFRRAMWLAM